MVQSSMETPPWYERRFQLVTEPYFDYYGGGFDLYIGNTGLVLYRRVKDPWGRISFTPGGDMEAGDNMLRNSTLFCLALLELAKIYSANNCELGDFVIGETDDVMFQFRTKILNSLGRGIVRKTNNVPAQSGGTILHIINLNRLSLHLDEDSLFHRLAERARNKYAEQTYEIDFPLV